MTARIKRCLSIVEIDSSRYILSVEIFPDLLDELYKINGIAGIVQPIPGKEFYLISVSHLYNFSDVVEDILRVGEGFVPVPDVFREAWELPDYLVDWAWMNWKRTGDQFFWTLWTLVNDNLYSEVR